MDKIVVWGALGIRKWSSAILILGVNPRSQASRMASIRNAKKSFSGSRIVGGLEQLRPLRESGVEWLIFGFGDCDRRIKPSEVAKSMGFRLATAIHPGAIIARDATLRSGVVVAAGAMINSCTLIAEDTIINTSSSVDRDCSIDYVARFCPGAHLADQVILGRSTWFGIGATVLDHVQIGSGSLIGAGALMVEDIPDSLLRAEAPPA